MTGTPGEREAAAVREYVAEVVGCPVSAITGVSRFEHGNRHAVHRVTYASEAGTQDVVVRISFGGESADVAQAEREAAVLEVVGGSAAPELFDFRATSDWFQAPAMCMQYLPGPSRDLDAVENPQIEQLGALVAWVHQRPRDALDGALGPATTVTAYAEERLQTILGTLSWARDPLPAELQDGLGSAADELAAGFGAVRDAVSFATAGTLSLLHGDIAPGNVLWGRRPLLIDWEYTRLGDPADELAYTFDQNGLSPSQREAFWTGYAQGLGERSLLAAVQERVAWWEPVTLLGSALWWVERWVRRTELESRGREDPAVPREADYYFERLTSRTDRLKTVLAS